MPAPLCLASCFLPLDESNSQWWRTIQDALAQTGMELVLLSHAPSVDPQLRTIVIPIWLQGYGQAYRLPPGPITLEPALADALARRDRSWSGQESKDLAEFHHGLDTCQQVLRAILEELQPAVVLVWGNSLPQSVVLQHIARQQGRPCWVIERGLLPSTLMIELDGQGGQSELNTSFALHQALAASPNTRFFAEAQAFSQRNPGTKYAQAQPLSPDAFRAEFNPQGRPLIAFPLQHDAASCLVPEDYLGALSHSSAYRSSTHAIQALAEAAASHQALLLVKPHPTDSQDYSHLENESVRILKSVNLRSLLSAADVVATMTSTTQFEALLLEKPILLLARSQLANKGAAYEALHPEALPQALRQALEGHDFPNRQRAAQRFISFALEHFSIALSPDSPAPHSPVTLAQFLRHNAINLPTAPSSNQGLAALGRLMKQWEDAQKSTSPLPAYPACLSPEPNAPAPTPHTPPPRKPNHDLTYYSHIGQDAWVAQCLRFKRNGFFLDFGAFDGRTISNTLALEESLGWKGICVEPNPHYFPDLCRCRSSINVNVALWPQSRQRLRFIDAHGLSSLESFKNADANANRRSNATRSTIEVDTLNPNELLTRFSAPQLIDYLSLDVEGAEMEILQALDLTFYSIALMTVEHNHQLEHQRQIRAYLASFGYQVVQNRNDDFFFHPEYLQRALANHLTAPHPASVNQQLLASYPIPDLTGKANAPKPTPPPAPSMAEKVMATLSTSPDAILTMATSLAQQGHWNQVEFLLKSLTDRFPDHLPAWQARLHGLHQLGFEVMADLLTEEILERHPEWSAALDPKELPTT